jgi:segregation and condensation protein A
MFSIRLPDFEGPFDLLLYFIERDELDIGDIPIAQITDDFLTFIHERERLNIEVASEFILFAATLMGIKAKMLLPRPQLNDAGEAIDPRADLVRHLLEYRKFKEAAAQLSALEDIAMSRFARANLAQELEAMSAEVEDTSPLVNLTLTNLALTFQKVLLQQLERARYQYHVVVQVPYTIEDQKAWIGSQLATQRQVDFVALLEACADRLQKVFTFMAVLEMLNERVLTLIMEDDELGANKFKLGKTTYSLPEAAPSA